MKEKYEAPAIETIKTTCCLLTVSGGFTESGTGNTSTSDDEGWGDIL